MACVSDRSSAECDMAEEYDEIRDKCMFVNDCPIYPITKWKLE